MARIDRAALGRANALARKSLTSAERLARLVAESIEIAEAERDKFRAGRTDAATALRAIRLAQEIASDQGKAGSQPSGVTIEILEADLAGESDPAGEDPDQAE